MYYPQINGACILSPSQVLTLSCIESILGTTVPVLLFFATAQVHTVIPTCITEYPKT